MQKNLLGDIETKRLTTVEAANIANVSTATIRNWVKTGYLKEFNRNEIDGKSLAHFMENIAGKEKLTLRANKSMKDEHNHFDLSARVEQKINGKDWLKISEEYEQSLSNSYRNKEGIYYTPSFIAADMLENIIVEAHSTFLDPCCGSGNYILAAIKKGIKPENVFGFDIDSNAIEITKKRIFEETGFNAENNIQKIDFLEEAHLLAQQRKYDLIFTNPPWGKKLKKPEKEKFSILYKTGKSTDTTSLFYFAAMRLLKENGQLGFLVQEALFNIATFQDTRKNILKHKILEFVDYGKPFKGLLTKACSFILANESSTTDEIHCRDTEKNYTRKQDTFFENPKQVLNFWVDTDDANIIRHVYSIPHQTLKNRAKWALGIVTGNNAKFCKNTEEKEHVAIYKGADITTTGLKEASNFIPNDFSKYQQVAPLKMYEAPQKLIYKFISSKLVFFCDTQQRHILNSANLVIPDESIGISNLQIAELLSSEFMNWIFQALFKTHKVLRGDIEQLPIHTDYFKEHKKFEESSYIDFLGLEKETNGTYSIKR